MTLRVPSMCMACKHLERETVRYDASEQPKCAAYPDGIPDGYWIRGVPHTDPDGSDSGITFDLKPGREDDLEVYVQFWFEPSDEGPPEESGRSRLEVDL